MIAARPHARSRIRRRLALVAAVLVGIVVVPASPVSVTPAAAAGFGAGGEYHALTPQRIYDSRAISPVNEANPGPKPADPSAPTFDIQLLGLGGVPTDVNNVLAVVVNITVAEPTGEGWLNAYGAGAEAGTASILNFDTNQIVPNLSIVRPGADGKLTIKLFSSRPGGTAQVIVDVFGWFSTSANPDRGARLIPVAPGRLYDSRNPGNQPLGTAGSVELTIQGATLENGVTVPSDVVGVVLNLTGVNDQPDSTGTFVSVVPDLAPGEKPSTSNVNLVRGQVKPNMVMVPVGADGKIHIYNNSGATNIVVDVAGYLQADLTESKAGRIVPLTAPFRVLDTREAAWGAVALGAGQAEDWSFSSFVSSVKIGTASVGDQMAVIGNLTSASLTPEVAGSNIGSFLTVYPSDQPRPNASNLNTVAGNKAVANLAILKYSASKTVRVYNLQGFSHYLYDAAAVILTD
ncbi:MAG: hypothetical protein AB7L17_18255 [Ilumatobacteraceae bacterium]